MIGYHHVLMVFIAVAIILLCKFIAAGRHKMLPRVGRNVSNKH